MRPTPYGQIKIRQENFLSSIRNESPPLRTIPVEASSGMTYQDDSRTTSPRLTANGANTPPAELFQLTMLRAMLLPPRCRDVYVLKEMHGYAPDEIARALGMSTTDVKRHLRRAVREMSEK